MIALVDTSYFLNSAHDRVLRLGLERSVIVALASAQQLSLAAGNADPEISAALAMGWDRDVEASARASVASDLGRRPDVDDDVVAATIYALGASLGSLDDAWWAVARFIDAAFDRVQYDQHETTFRSLDEDASQPEVRRELDWLDRTLTIAEASADSLELTRQLRVS
ncbi:hypothetical protein [Leifsonia sp. SIMBA_070]|uniref:hypothetical protein n=1 Tax=Leifsonia sp. SIMBA_070 TaxID=3085810 RepID=UPI00397884F2